MAKRIPLTNGGYAVVDDSTYPSLVKHKWHKHPQGYASTRIGSKKVLMHRMIMGMPDGDTDHINHDKLDNRRANLRACTRSQNKANMPKMNGTTTSKYKGVDWRGDLGKWRATIRVNYKKIHLGLFLDEEAAAKSYDEAAKKHFGDFAYLNFRGGA